MLRRNLLQLLGLLPFNSLFLLEKVEIGLKSIQAKPVLYHEKPKYYAVIGSINCLSDNPYYCQYEVELADDCCPKFNQSAWVTDDGRVTNINSEVKLFSIINESIGVFVSERYTKDATKSS